ncbi:hypothetical protein ACFQ3Z_20515 [Streptomyces nogalater]
MSRSPGPRPRWTPPVSSSTGRPPPPTGMRRPADAVRNARDAALAMDLVVTAVSRQYRLLGTGGQSEPRFQRPWRDITTAAGHAVLAFEAAGRAYADESITSRRAPHVVRRDTRSHRA